jgi:hypothetical protein
VRRRALGIVLVVCAIASAGCRGSDGDETSRPARTAGPREAGSGPVEDAVPIGAAAIRSVVLDDAGNGAVTAEAEVTGVDGIDRIVVLGTRKGGAISPTAILGFDQGERVATIATDATGGIALTLADGSAVAAAAAAAAAGASGTARRGAVVDADGSTTEVDVPAAESTTTSEGAFGVRQPRLIAATSAAGPRSRADLVVPTRLVLTRAARVPLTVVAANGNPVDSRTYGGLDAECQSPVESVVCAATVEYGRFGLVLPEPVAVQLLIRVSVPISEAEGRAIAAETAACAQWSAGLNGFGLALGALGIIVEAAGTAAAIPGIGIGIGLVGATTSLYQVLSEDCSTKVTAAASYQRALAAVAATNVVLRLRPRLASQRVEPAALTFRPLTITTPAPVRLVVGTPGQLAARPAVDPGPATFAVAVIEEHLDVTQGGACGAEPSRSYPTIQKHTIEVILGAADAVRSRVASAPKRSPGGWTPGYQGISCNYFKVLASRADLVAADVTRAEAEAAFAEQAPGAAPGGVVLFGAGHNLEGSVSGASLIGQ